MPEQTYLYLHQMDEVDFKLYRDRLERAWEIIDKSGKPQLPKKPNTDVRYRLKDGDRGDFIAHVSRYVDRMGRPHFKLWTDHSNGTSNFCITNPLRLGEKDFKPQDPNAVLDHLELLLNEADFAFDDRGRVGPEHAAAVAAKDKQTFEIVNAFIHNYLEFEAGRRFVLRIRSLQPYALAAFHEVIDGKTYDFLTPKTIERINWFVPHVSKVDYRRENGLSIYDVCPADPVDIIITAEDMPKAEDMKRILTPFSEIPAPHMLDSFPEVRVYNW